ncbi:hypothetical protein GCM10020370_30120 [Paenibacillus hodogayensis]
MRITMQSTLRTSPDLLWASMKRPSAFRKVASPLMAFRYADNANGFPAQWSAGKPYRLRMYLLGWLPLGHHTITFATIDDGRRTVTTDETGRLFRTWRHTMRVTRVDERTSVFRDELSFDSGLFTLPASVGVYLFFAYRHMRLKQLIRSGWQGLS